ncbi:MAG: hypothetical protein CMJ58_12220 [Planctomycetaceae bacterium]|nr:hypothetical protein [Planctomycetaceae bacterium]
MKVALGFAFSLLIASAARADRLVPREYGVNSRVTGLTGEGGRLGEFDLERAPDPDFDTNPNIYHTQVNPFRLYYDGNNETTTNRSPDGHALAVASMMIGTSDPDFRLAGVSPAAPGATGSASVNALIA